MEGKGLRRLLPGGDELYLPGEYSLPNPSAFSNQRCKPLTYSHTDPQRTNERRKRFWKSDGKDRDSTSRSAISFSLRFAGRVLFHLNSSFFSHSFMSFARLRFSLLTSWSSFYSLLLYLCFRREEKEDKLTHDSRVVRKQSLAHFRFPSFSLVSVSEARSKNRKPRKRKMMKNESGKDLPRLFYGFLIGVLGSLQEYDSTLPRLVLSLEYSCAVLKEREDSKRPTPMMKRKP